MPERPEVSVCIVNYNGGGHTEAAVASVWNNAPQIPIEVVVVDNASTDDSLARVLRRWPNVRVIKNDTNVGFGRANNQAMQIAEGRYFLLLNNDAALEPSALARMLQAAESDPRVAFVGCRVVNGEGNLQPTYEPSPSLRDYLPAGVRRRRLGRVIETAGSSELRARAARRYGERYGYASSHTVEWLCGVCLLVKRAAALEIGLFDEHFFIYYEDVDWSLRATRAGWKLLYVADARLRHAWLPLSAKSQSAFLIRHRRFSHGLYYRRHCGAATFYAFAGALALRWLVRWPRSWFGRANQELAKQELLAFWNGGRAALGKPKIPYLPAVATDSSARAHAVRK